MAGALDRGGEFALLEQRDARDEHVADQAVELGQCRECVLCDGFEGCREAAVDAFLEPGRGSFGVGGLCGGGLDLRSGAQDAVHARRLVDLVQVAPDYFQPAVVGALQDGDAAEHFQAAKDKER